MPEPSFKKYKNEDPLSDNPDWFVMNERDWTYFCQDEAEADVAVLVFNKFGPCVGYARAQEAYHRKQSPPYDLLGMEKHDCEWCAECVGRLTTLRRDLLADIDAECEGG